MLRTFHRSKMTTGMRPKSTIADELARDQKLLEALFAALSGDVVFRTGPVRVARRDWSVEFLTVDGRIGAWFVEDDMFVYFAAADLSDHDFVPLHDINKSRYRAVDLRQAILHSRAAIGPYLKRRGANPGRLS